MVKIVNLKIKSNPITGDCTASLQILKDGILTCEEEDAALPNFLDLENHYKQWWRRMISLSSRSPDDDDIQINPKIVTNRSTLEGAEACRRYAKLVEEKMQAWLKTPVDSGWQNIRETLVKELGNSQDEVHIVIKSDSALWKFPWHRWDLIENKPHIGVLFSFISSQVGESITPYKFHDMVRILAVFGDDINIDLKPDRQVLDNLPDAEIKFLDKPKAEEFKAKIRQPEGWDILFFAGHGEIKDKTGRIYLNNEEYLEVYDFKHSLKEAIDNGLKIAIFNSCEGLGLIEDLGTLGLPIAIFMQEKVPDKVAQFFLKEFLSEYVSGKTLYEAFNLARNRLEEKSKYVPGATLIPKLNQNTPILAPKWQDLQGGTNRSNSIEPGDGSGSESAKIAVAPKLRKDKKSVVFKTLLISLLVTTAVMGMRWFGFLQTSELQAFDRLMQQRPAEHADSRILVVEGDEKDVQQYKYPFPDRTLVQLLDKIEQYQPAVIGLNIYRDLPQQPGHDELVDYFNTSQKTIAICKYTADEEGIAPPPVKSLKDRSQIGFTNLPLDTPYSTVRRYLLTRSPNAIDKSDPCNTNYSLGFMLAWRYSYAKGIPVSQKKDNWYFDRTPIRRLSPHSGGYQNVASRGYQITLNYRKSSKSDSRIAQSVTVGDILEDRLESEWLKNKVQGKIVLIGMNASSTPRGINTSYGEMPGVWIHAHVVSQILSAVEDRRPLIWWLPVWGDAIWVWMWSLTGGTLILAWQLSRRWKLWHLFAAISLLLAILYSICSVFFWQGGWLPLIPSVISFVATAVGIAISLSSRTSPEKLEKDSHESL